MMSPCRLATSVVVWAACALCLFPATGVAQWQDSAPSGWQSYPPSQQQQQPYPPAAVSGSGGGGGCGAGGGILPDLSSLKSGILQTGASAAIVALLAKLPALIFLKVIVFKLIVVPMLFMFVAMPVLMPLLMMLMPMMMNMMNMMGGGDMMSTSTTTTTAAPSGRRIDGDTLMERGRGAADGGPVDLEGALRAVLGSQSCLERVACTLGDRHRSSPYRKPVTWLLQQLQGMVPAELRSRVKSYRQAYVAGAGLGACDHSHYPCDQPSLTVQQDGRSYRVL